MAAHHLPLRSWSYSQTASPVPSHTTEAEIPCLTGQGNGEPASRASFPTTTTPSPRVPSPPALNPSSRQFYASNQAFSNDGAESLCSDFSGGRSSQETITQPLDFSMQNLEVNGDDDEAQHENDGVSELAVSIPGAHGSAMEMLLQHDRPALLHTFDGGSFRQALPYSQSHSSPQFSSFAPTLKETQRQATEAWVKHSTSPIVAAFPLSSPTYKTTQNRLMRQTGQQHDVPALDRFRLDARQTSIQPSDPVSAGLRCLASDSSASMHPDVRIGAHSHSTNQAGERSGHWTGTSASAIPQHKQLSQEQLLLLLKGGPRHTQTSQNELLPSDPPRSPLEETRSAHSIGSSHHEDHLGFFRSDSQQDDLGRVSPQARAIAARHSEECRRTKSFASTPSEPPTPHSDTFPSDGVHSPRAQTSLSSPSSSKWNIRAPSFSPSSSRSGSHDGHIKESPTPFVLQSPPPPRNARSSLSNPIAVPLAPPPPPPQHSKYMGNGPSPNNRKYTLYKTELCRSWEEKGSCRYGNKCQFAHGKEELRVVLRHPKFKTEICRTFWKTGHCPYAKRCCFIHANPGSSTAKEDEPELAKKPPLIARVGRAESAGNAVPSMPGSDGCLGRARASSRASAIEPPSPHGQIAASTVREVFLSSGKCREMPPNTSGPSSPAVTRRRAMTAHGDIFSNRESSVQECQAALAKEDYAADRKRLSKDELSPPDPRSPDALGAFSPYSAEVSPPWLECTWPRTSSECHRPDTDDVAQTFAAQPAPWQGRETVYGLGLASNAELALPPTPASSCGYSALSSPYWADGSTARAPTSLGAGSGAKIPRTMPTCPPLDSSFKSASPTLGQGTFAPSSQLDAAALDSGMTHTSASGAEAPSDVAGGSLCDATKRKFEGELGLDLGLNSANTSMSEPLDMHASLS